MEVSILVWRTLSLPISSLSLSRNYEQGLLFMCWPEPLQQDTEENSRKTPFAQAPTPHSSGGKESVCNAGDPASIPGSERSPGEGNSNPLQYSWLENPMVRKAWQATVHEVTRVGHDLATPMMASHEPHTRKHFLWVWHHRNLVLEKLIWPCRCPTFPGVHPSYLGSVNYYLSIMKTKRNLKALQYFVCIGNINFISPDMQKEHQIIIVLSFWLL